MIRIALPLWRRLRLICLLAVAASLSICVIDGYADQPLPTGHYTLTAVEVVPIERSVVEGKTNYHKSDTLTHGVRFDVRPKFTRQANTKSKPFKITNATVATKSSLTVDKPVRFKGREIPAGTNLMKFKKFDGSRFNVSMPALNPFAIGSIRVGDDFQFPAGTYQLEFRWETADGKTISDTVTVRIDIGAAKEK